MHIDAKFGTKIRPVGVEILEAKHSLDLAKRYPGYCMYMLSSAPWKGKSIHPYVDFAQ